MITNSKKTKPLPAESIDLAASRKATPKRRMQDLPEAAGLTDEPRADHAGRAFGEVGRGQLAALEPGGAHVVKDRGRFVMRPVLGFDREDAFELLWFREPELRQKLLKAKDDKAAAALAAKTICGGPLGALGWAASRVGMPMLTAFGDGVQVTNTDAGRRGLLSWEEIAAEARCEEEDEAPELTSADELAVGAALCGVAARKGMHRGPFHGLTLGQAETIVRSTLIATPQLKPLPTLAGEPDLIRVPAGAGKVAARIEIDGRKGHRTEPQLAYLMIQAAKNPDMTGTTTPAGIEANDPDVAPKNGKRRSAAELAAAGEGVELVAIKLAEIDASKNPRRAFDQAKLDELTASIKAHGILQPIVVRTGQRTRVNSGGKMTFELIAGERRLRAAKAAGIEKAVCRVIDVTDSVADELRLIENLQREDLTAIEEGEAFEAMCKRHGYTHDALAAKLGCSQGHVTNRIRLLRLPKSLKQRVISREMPPTHARCLVPYVDYPMLLKEIEWDVIENRYGGAPLALKDFEAAVQESVEQNTEPLFGRSYRGSHGRDKIGVFKPTDAQLAKLAPITIDGKQYATNTRLWCELQEAHGKVLGDLAEKKGSKKSAAKDAKPLTAAEQKAEDARARVRKKEQAAHLREWVKNWRSDWLRRILSVRVIEDRDLAVRAVVMGLAYGCEADHNDQRILELIEPRTAGLKQERAIAGDTAAGAMEVLVQLAADWLWNEYQAECEPGKWHGRTLDGDAVEALAEVAKIDLAEFWRSEASAEGGPWLVSEAFFNRHTSADLVAIAKELKVAVTPGSKKSELVGTLMASPSTWRRLPSAIKPVAKPKAKKR